MNIRKETVDMFLVLAGLFLMLGYHTYLVYRILKRPEGTTIGYENHNKRAWIARMHQADLNEASLALSVITCNITASNMLASLSIALSSLIGAWVGNTSQLFTRVVIFGDTSMTMTSIKYISLLVCFLIAFTSFIQSARHYVHASFLITMLDSDIPVKYVQTLVIRGSNFWTVGLRALYFATTLMLWFFGPIPMFVTSVIMVSMLYVLDTNSTQLHDFKFNNLQGKTQRMKQNMAFGRR